MCKNINLVIIVILLIIICLLKYYNIKKKIPKDELTRSLINLNKCEPFSQQIMQPQMIQPNIQNTPQPDKRANIKLVENVRKNINNYKQEVEFDVSELGENGTNISKPNYFDKVDYKPIVCPNNIKKIKKAKNNDAPCYNDSLLELHKTGPKPLEKNKMLSCDQNQQEEDNNFDPSMYYKENNKPFVGQLEDECFKGFNYSKYSNISRYFDVGNITLERSNKYPVGNNFAFTESGIDI
jgi:hypothetical protein